MESRIIAVLAVAFVSYGCGSTPAQSTEGVDSQIQYTGQVESRAALNPLPDESTVVSKDYKATLVLRTYDEERDLPRFHGYHGAQTVRVVDNFTATWKGEEVHIPMSTYADLSNVLVLRIESVGDTAIVFIEGGDGGDSYICRIYIKEDQVVRRVVESPSFPEYHNETTTYTNFSPDN